jgi:ATP-dependent helicase HrpB
MLPIYQVEDQILESLRQSNRLVLSAPTGSGKTTQVPQMILRHNLAPGQIVVLEPRRLATRLVAQRVASEMGCRTGELVGYQTRHDSQIGRATRLRFITEGLFLRLLQSDGRLGGIGAVILDEFHERSLACDTALAMLKVLQESHRPDLKLLVMSATLDVAALRNYLRCPSVEAAGRMYPVQVHYLEQASTLPCWDLAAEALAAVLDTQAQGDVLIFMPGAYEIRRTLDACRRVAGDDSLLLLPLHGDLPAEQQDQAVRPDPGGRRKVIVSTNVAETSITIEGVRHVIDSGLARVQRFDPRRGINVLDVEAVSQGSAQQRTGRAGRLAPGTCYRLWTAAEDHSRPPQTTAEVRRLDLAEVLLQLKALGIADLDSFPWLEPPTAPSIRQALGVLAMLGAIDARGRLTDTGRRQAALPMHPRLSRMLVDAARRGCLRRAALWAALVSERDILLRNGGEDLRATTQGRHPTDFLVLERALDVARAARFDPRRCTDMGISAPACREVDRTAALFLEACSRSTGARPDRHGADAPEDVLKCLLLAFPDHLAVRRGADNLACALSGKRRGELDPHSIARGAPLVLAVDIAEVGTGKGVRTNLGLASAVEPAWLEEVHPGRVRREVAVEWNPDKRAVERVERLCFDDLTIEQAARGEPPAQPAAELLADLVAQGRLQLAGWDQGVEQWISRVRCVAEWFPEHKLLTYDAQDRRVILEEICAGAVRYSQIEDRPCLAAVRGAMSGADQRFVEQMAPPHIALPGGWKMKIEYQAGAPPKGRAKIQDLYGLKSSPAVAGGRQRVILEILGPNFRPVQTTDDLAGFWKKLYPVLKKELARKYPRHEWR